MPRHPLSSSSGSVAMRASVWTGAVVVVAAVIGLVILQENCRIEVPYNHIAVLIRKTGKDLQNADEIAPDAQHKGVQKDVLTEGHYWFTYNPYDWSWRVIPQFEVPVDKRGVRIRLTGDDLPYGEFLVRADGQKGIVPGTLAPGRYPLNPYLETIELHPLAAVPAGFQGVVTNLAGKRPTREEDYVEGSDASHSHRLLVKPGYRGVQKETLTPGTYPINPYEESIHLVDCRNQRFNLADSRDLGFPSKDGFWVSLDSIVEFRVNPEMAAQVFVLYNEEPNGDRLDEEIVRKIILPAARSFCRLQGSNNVGREFIQGSTRTQFQESYQTTMRTACEPLGIHIVNALITKINPPEQIAQPVRLREIAKQKEKQYQQQILQQKSEEKLAIDKAMVLQKQAVVKAEQAVIRVTTEAQREQEVAVTKGQERLAVAQLRLEATRDEAAAIASRGKAAADVVQLENAASATGWKRTVTAFNGNAHEYAQFVLYQKLASAYENIMVNTADSPLMKIFDTFAPHEEPAGPSDHQPHKLTAGPASD